MSQQLLTESQEKTNEQIARRETSPDSAQSFRGGLHPISQLQRTLGNRRVAQLIQARRLTPEGKIIGFQRKLTVGAADDQFEQEADRVAHQVMNTPDAVAANSMQRDISPEKEKDQTLQTNALAASITPVVHRQTEASEEPEDKEKPVQAMFVSGPSKGPLPPPAGSEEEEEKKPLQAKSAGARTGTFEAGADVETQVSRSKGRGSPLPDPVRSFMEPRFGVDFSQVRVHTDSNAIQMNRDVGAQAFTHGSDIYFGENRSPGDLELTAHELTHVIQQTGSAPLQRKKSEERQAPLGPEPSIQRICGACAAGESEEKAQSISQDADQNKRLMRRTFPQGSGGAMSTAAQRSAVRERTGGPLVQGAWTATETLTNSTPVIGNTTRDHGSTFALPMPTGVFGTVSAKQVAAWIIEGGNAHLTMRRNTRYTFVHTGSDNNVLKLRVSANIFGGAEADDKHYAKADAAVVGNIAVRTISNPAPDPTELFPPVKDGRRSEATDSAIGDVEVSLPVGKGTVDVKIPLKRTDEGQLATLSQSHALEKGVPGGGEWKSVDVYLLAYMEAAADIEEAVFWDVAGDVNWAHVKAEYSLEHDEQVIPAAPAPPAATPGADTGEEEEDLGEGEVDVAANKDSCKTNPGKCTVERCEQLQAVVEKRCRIKFKCKKGDSCEKTKSNMRRAEKCAQARQAINQECYDGGNKGHRQAERDARVAQENCRQLLKENC